MSKHYQLVLSLSFLMFNYSEEQLDPSFINIIIIIIIIFFSSDLPKFSKICRSVSLIHSTRSSYHARLSHIPQRYEATTHMPNVNVSNILSRCRDSAMLGVYYVNRLWVCLFNRLWDCPEEGSFKRGLGSVMFIVAYELE